MKGDSEGVSTATAAPAPPPRLGISRVTLYRKMKKYGLMKIASPA